jgi:peptidoglycan/LPS O-acetylase OafA/YrhL
MEERQVLKMIAASMVIVTASLAVMSSLHLAGVVGTDAKSYNGTAAGVAEAIIAVALAAGAIALRRDPVAGRNAAIAALVFAVAGFLLGISITAQSGYVPDIAYHASVLPILIGDLVVLLATRRSGKRLPQPLSEHAQ